MNEYLQLNQKTISFLEEVSLKYFNTNPEWILKFGFGFRIYPEDKKTIAGLSPIIDELIKFE